MFSLRSPPKATISPVYVDFADRKRTQAPNLNDAVQFVIESTNGLKMTDQNFALSKIFSKSELANQ